jgi:3-oxoacyl-[acyl-carrier-protein] synthase III
LTWNRKKKIKSGDTVVLAAFGSGFQGSAIIKW